jgi:hypothetical protein
MTQSTPIDILNDLITVITQGGQTVSQVEGHLGQVEPDANGHLLLKPDNEAIIEAEVMPQLQSDQPYLIRLTFNEATPLEALEKAFGEYRTPPLREGLPRQVIFYLDPEGQPYRAALLAAVREQVVRTFSIRRDPRLT